jgi:hypothetical protein
MNRNQLAAFAAPAIALAAVGISAAFASGDGFRSDAAYGATLARLSADAACANGAETFLRADLDKSGALDANEYAALAVVTAELSRLNGFVGFETEGGVQTVALPVRAPEALVGGERARVEAVARAGFYAAAGADGLMSLEEYAGERVKRFAEADRNRNGVLAKDELVSYAAKEASVLRSDA